VIEDNGLSGAEGQPTTTGSQVPISRLFADELFQRLDDMISPNENNAAAYYAGPVPADEIPDLGSHNDGKQQAITIHLSGREIFDRSIKEERYVSFFFPLVFSRSDTYLSKFN